MVAFFSLVNVLLLLLLLFVLLLSCNVVIQAIKLCEKNNFRRGTSRYADVCSDARCDVTTYFFAKLI